MKRIVLIFFVTLLVFASTTFISGAKPENTPKEEIIYGILDDSGNLTSITVVNGFTLEKDATIADYGNYTSIENLSTSEPITKSGESITFAGKTGRTTYRGELANRQLPWNVKITYYLDGKEINPADLDGKSGKLKIALKTSENAKEKGTFYDDFSLQITVPLKMDLCKNIETSGATVADNGSTKQFSYVVLPGKDASISLTSDVTDFEMEGITLAGVRMSFDLPLDIDTINSSIDKLVAAAGKLDKGAVKLVSGAKALQTGLQQYTEGFNLLNSKVGQMESGAAALESGISDLGDGLSALSDQGAGLRAGAESIQQSVFDSANASLTGMGIPTLTPENYTAVLSALPANPMLDPLKKQLDDITAFTAGIEAYTLGTTQLASGAAALETGAGNLAGGISTLAEGLNQLYGSAKELNSGMKTFLQGVSTYRTGTKAFSAGTGKMEKQLNSQLDSMMNLLSAEGKVFHSYVSDDNTNVNFVQFVIKTDGIAIQKEEPASEPKPAEKSLWEKFLDLFK
jgi:X-X-X-Leu-X-X-Gly heptad repeat protein